MRNSKKNVRDLFAKNSPTKRATTSKSDTKPTKSVGKKDATTSTNALTKTIISLLNLSGFHVWRQNNMGVYDSKIGRYRANSAKLGVSDIIGYHKATGKFIAVEIKRGKDVVSPYQEVFLEGIRKAGGFAFVAKSFDAFRKELEEVLASCSCQ